MRRSNWHHVRSVLTQVWYHPLNRGRRARAIAGAVRWQASKRFRPVARDLPYFGLTLRAHPDSGSAANVVYFTERFDPDEMEVLEALLGPGDRFVDVGANIGAYTLFAAALVGPSGHVDAFEPHPVAMARLRENVERNGLRNVTVHQAAVADQRGTAEFLTTFDVANSILVPVDVGEPTTVVDTVTLDDALGTRPATVGKIDIEGFETAAFRGARRRLATLDPPVWLLEVMEWQLAKAGSSTAELFDLLRSAGFVITRYDRTVRRLVPLPSDDPRIATGNLWAVAGDRLDEVAERLDRARISAAPAPTRRT